TQSRCEVSFERSPLGSDVSLTFRVKGGQLLSALTDTSTFLGKKILVEPFTCQSKPKG
ncbi:hypothetical protein JOQ06_002456, partial [Pogonophryne albipinna]